MASSCDRVVPLIADQMRPGTERAQMGVLGGGGGETEEAARESCIIDQLVGGFLRRK